MKKLSVFVVLLLVCTPFIRAHDDSDGNNDEDDDGYNASSSSSSSSTPYSCDLKTDTGVEYDVEDLYKSQGSAYSAFDSNGNLIYFNLCGDLSSLAEGSLGCNPSSASCIQTAYNSYINAGTPYSDWEQTEDGQGIQIVYTGGDSCYTDDGEYVSYQTTIVLNCSNSNDFDVVYATVDNCQVTIQALSMDGCPMPPQSQGIFLGPIFMFTLSCLVCCTLTLCCCACIRRRRACQRQRQQHVEMKYQPVPQQPRASVPAPQPQPMVPMMPMPVQVPMHMQPYVMPIQYQPVPQYFQPQPYYQPQAPPHFAPEPLVSLEDVNPRENQISSDEQIARELQAKFDNE